MRVKYVGHPDGCDLVRENGGWQTVAHGEVIEVSSELGNALLEQPSNWSTVGAKSAAKTTTKKSGAKGAAKKSQQAPPASSPVSAAAATQTTP